MLLLVINLLFPMRWATVWRIRWHLWFVFSFTTRPSGIFHGVGFFPRMSLMVWYSGSIVKCWNDGGGYRTRTHITGVWPNPNRLRHAGVTKEYNNKFNFRALDLLCHFLMVWYYCTLTIRESILRINGSKYVLDNISLRRSWLPHFWENSTWFRSEIV